MSYFIDASDRKPMELAPGVHTRTFWGEQMLLSLVEVDANTEMPLHTHPNEQGGIIIEGEFELGIGGEVKVLNPGDIYISSPAAWSTTPKLSPPRSGPWASTARSGKSLSTDRRRAGSP